MEIQFENIRNDCVQMVAHDQTVVHSEIDTADRGGVRRLLSVSTEAVVQSAEAVAGEAHVYGRVNYKILYLDAEDKVCGLDYFGEFDFVLQDERIAVGAVSATVGVLDAECTVADNVIKPQAVIDVRLLQVVSHAAEVVVDAQCEVLRQPIEAVALTPVAEASFEVVEEVESRQAIDRVLLFDAHAVQTGTRAGLDSTTVEGKVYAQVIYRSQGELLTKDIVFDFAEQLDIEGDVDLSVFVRQSKLVLTGEDDNNILRVEMVLSVTGYRIATTALDAVQDAYADGEDVVLSRDCFVCRRFEGMYARSERIVAEPSQLPDVGQVIAATVARIHVANYVAGEGQITAEGLAVAGILYLDTEGAMQAGEVEMPFSLSFAAEGVSPECVLAGEAVAMGVSATARGRIEMNVQLVVKSYCPTSVSYTTQIDVQPYDAPQAVLSVYFAPAGATLWQIAHAVHVSPASLLAEDATLADPSDEVRRVTVFRHRELR